MTSSSLAEQQYNTDSAESHHLSILTKATGSDELSTVINHLSFLQEAFRPAGGFIEIRTFDEKNPSGSKFGRSVFIPVDAEPSQIKSFARYALTENGQGRGAFVGVNPRAEEDGSKKSIPTPTTAVVDIDLKNSTYSKEEAIEIIKDRSPIEPDAIVNSGGGYHVYFVMQPHGDHDDLVNFQSTLQEMFEDLGADKAIVTDYSRVLRLAGTRNWKYEKEEGGRATSLVEYTHRDRTPSMASYTVMFDVKPRSRKATGKRGIPEAVTAGGTTEFAGRNSFLTSKAGSWRRDGMDADEILPSLQVINQKRCVPPLPDEEVESIVRSISRYEPAKSLVASADSASPADEYSASVDSSSLLRSGGDIRRLVCEPVEWLFRGLARGEVSILSAVQDAGKSTLLYNASISAALGVPFLPLNDGHFVEGGRRLRPSIFDMENTDSKIQKDFERMTAHLSDEERALIDENIAFYSGASAENPLNLSNPEHIEAFEKAIIEHRSDVVIVDTMSQAFLPDNENDNSEAARIVRSLMRVARNTNAAVIFTHHMGKRNPDEGGASNSTYRSRGGSAYESNVRTVMYLDKKTEDESLLIFKKIKGTKPENVVIKLNPETRWYDAAERGRIHEVSDTGYSQVVRIVLSANGEIRTSEIKAKAAPLSESTVEKHLRKAVSAGEVIKTRSGIYAPANWTPEGCPEGMDCQDLTLTYPAVN